MSLSTTVWHSSRPPTLSPDPVALDEAFAAKHMPDLGHDVKEFQVFHWKVPNWKKLEKKITGPSFECGGHKWSVLLLISRCFPIIDNKYRQILLFPFGNSNAPPNDTVSVYLDYANPKDVKEGWHACAQFALVISNIHDPTIYTVSRMLSTAFRPLNFHLIPPRRSPQVYKRGVRLGFYSLQRVTEAIPYTARAQSPNNRRRFR